MKKNRLISVLIVMLCTQGNFAQAPEEKTISNSFFTIRTAKYGLGELYRTNDVHPTNFLRKGRVFGEVIVRYANGRKLDTLRASQSVESEIISNGKTEKTWPASADAKGPLRISQSYTLENETLTWTFKLENTGAVHVRVEDLVIPIFYNSGGGENPKEIFEERVVKHHFISGNNSFLFFQRPTGLAPYLVMVPTAGTALDYFSTHGSTPADRGAFQAYIHSALTGNREMRGKWRQPHTLSFLQPNSSKNFGFKFRWAKDYNGIRDILVEEGLIDVQVMPGMSVPTDLETTIALRTKMKINTVEAEFESATKISSAGERQKGSHLYKIRFSHLGENKLTINYGDNYKTYLEFFVTEPLETLYKKRSAFIANSQQHKDHSKWYDGVFGIYDMKNAALRGPDNADYFDTSRLSYVLTCDDPGLCKAPFVAAKNVFYPDQKEINAVEYYIENFVWGKLQRTDKETPFAYGVYGTPNWLVNRDTAARRRNVNDVNRERVHVWRSYDYPHIMMMYYEMYKIAKRYPKMTHYLDSKGYLLRAKETAIAYFKYPYEILPWYETYKWGCYNELLIVELIDVLKKEGFNDEAKFLTAEWEKKVKYFIYDDPYPFRSEYAIDATAFESSYALAKYGVLNKMQPDSNLWFDKNVKRWYSHPQVKQEDAVLFMDRQLQANIALRGAIEPAYYFLGSDFRGKSDSYTLSYMSQMGGWGILDYALNFSDTPDDYIRLGYQSYLSSFALINSGTPESNYGYWFPGKENDGASGWAFEPQKYAGTWLQKPQGRGAWAYDGEIDLGFGGATRTATTIVTDDPIFGLVAYGGDLVVKNSIMYVTPKDGLRTRLSSRIKGNHFDIELSRDGFEKDAEVLIASSGKSIEFNIENRSNDAHEVTLNLKTADGDYRVSIDGKPGKKISVNKKGTPVNFAFPNAKKMHIKLERI